MSNKRKRLNLLNEYRRVIESLPFKTLEGEDLVAKNIYICPLCLTSFNIEETLDELTMEDVPPKSLGGKPIIITCKKCNNTCGHKLDVFLFNEFRYYQERYSFGVEGKTAQLSINGVQVNARIKEKEDKTLCIDIGRNNNPDKLKSFIENVEMVGEHWKIDGKINLIDFKRNEEAAKLAILKSAYLLAFHKLGYRYILNYNLNIVRDMIMYPEQNYETMFILGNTNTLNDIIKDDVYLAKIDNIGAILVVLSLRMNTLNRIYRFAVALPSSEDKEEVLYKKVLLLNECREKTVHIEIKGPAKITIKR